MPSAVPGQPLPPPAPDDPHWPLAADPTPPFVPTFEPSDFDDLDAPGWVNSPSSGGRAEHLDDTGERAVADGDRDALSSAQAQADRQARDRLISAVKVFVGIFLPGMLLVLGIGFLVKSVSGSSSDSNQDAAPASANSSPVAAQASAAPAPVADPLLDADALAITFVGHLAANDFESAALMTKQQHTADRVKELFGTTDRPLQPIVVDTDPAGRERYTVRMVIIAAAVIEDGAEQAAEQASVRCVDLDVVPLDGLVDVNSEPLDVTAVVTGTTGVDVTLAASRACSAAHLTALQN